MRFILASAFLLPLAFGSIGHGAINLAESSPPLAPILTGDPSAAADTLPDLVLAANGEKKGPKGDVGHGKIAQPAEQVDACGNAKRRGPKSRDGIDVGKVAGGDAADVDAKLACPPPKDLPPAVKGKGPKSRDKILTN